MTATMCGLNTSKKSVTKTSANDYLMNAAIWNRGDTGPHTGNVASATLPEPKRWATDEFIDHALSWTAA